MLSRKVSCSPSIKTHLLTSMLYYSNTRLFSSIWAIIRQHHKKYLEKLMCWYVNNNPYEEWNPIPSRKVYVLRAVLIFWIYWSWNICEYLKLCKITLRLTLPHTLHVCDGNLITGLTSAASPRVAISNTCKVGQKLAPLRRDHPGYCTAEVGNPGGT